MNYFKKANNSIKTALATYAITLLALLATIFLFFQGMMDIPLGILLGGFVCGSINLASGLLEKKDDEEKSTKYSIVFIIIRFVLFLGLTVLIALMYYLWDLKIFNLFAFIGAYTVSIIILIIIHLIYK